MGTSLPFNGLRGFATTIQPFDGCSSIEPPPNNITYQSSLSPKWVALIPKSFCPFEVQMQHAQDAKFDGVIFYSANSEADSARENKNEEIRIPSLVIGKHFVFRQLLAVPLYLS